MQCIPPGIDSITSALNGEAFIALICSSRRNYFAIASSVFVFTVLMDGITYHSDSPSFCLSICQPVCLYVCISVCLCQHCFFLFCNAPAFRKLKVIDVILSQLIGLISATSFIVHSSLALFLLPFALLPPRILSSFLLSYPLLPYPIVSYPSCPLLSSSLLSYPLLLILSYPLLSYPILFSITLSSFLLPYLLLSYPMLFCLILSSSLLSYPVISYHIIFSPILPLLY